MKAILLVVVAAALVVTTTSTTDGLFSPSVEPKTSTESEETQSTPAPTTTPTPTSGGGEWWPIATIVAIVVIGFFSLVAKITKKEKEA